MYCSCCDVFAYSCILLHCSVLYFIIFYHIRVYSSVCCSVSELCIVVCCIVVYRMCVVVACGVVYCVCCIGVL